MKQIIHAVHIHAAPGAVYKSITTKAGLQGWWTKKVDVEEREGGLIRFTFAGDFNPHMQQTKLEPNRRVSWKCVAGHANWQDNTFSFVLEERKGETLLMFSQDYARELSNEVYGTYNYNWGYYMNSLKLLTESGAGVPFTPPTAS